MRPPRRWEWPYPQSWREVYAVITGLLVGFLAVVYALDWLKQLLGRWPWKPAPQKGLRSGPHIPDNGKESER